MSLCNLSRQIIVERKPRTGAAVGRISSWVFSNSAFYLTEFGKEFVRACSETPGKWTLVETASDFDDAGKLDNAARWAPYQGP